MDKIIEELKLKMTIDTSSLDSDGKKFSNKLNNAIKEVVATADKLKKSFDLMTPQDIKSFEDGINKIAAKINDAHKQLKNNTLTSAFVGDIDKEAKNINKVMNVYLKSFSRTLSQETKLRERSLKNDLDLHKKTEETKLALSIINAKAIAREKNVQNRLSAAKELVDYKDLLKKKNKALRDAEKEANKKTFAQKVVGAGETLTKYAFGSVLASPAFALSQFTVNTFSEIIKGAAQYSRDIAQIKAITKATDEEMKGFAQSVKYLGTEFGYTATEGTEAILTISRLGVEAKNLSGVLNSTAAFAVATGSSLEKSGELLVNTMNAFGYAYEKSDYVMNQMTATLNASALDVEKYSTILGYVGAAAKETNISFEETNAMLTLLSKNGIKASTAGTSLREIFGTLTKNGKDFHKVLEELAAQNISYADAVDLVGKRAANALTILVKNNEALKETGKYIQLNILDTKAQAELMAQLSLVEQIARTWNGALTAAKEFFGSMLNADTKKLTESQLLNARVVTGGMRAYDIRNRDINDVANAFQLSTQEWLNKLSDKEKKSLGFGVDNQKQLEENFANAIANFIRNDETFKRYKGTDEMASEIADILAKKSRENRAEAFKGEAAQAAKRALTAAQQSNTLSVSENRFIYDFIQNYVAERNAGYYGLKFSSEDVDLIKQTGVSPLNTKAKARVPYEQAKRTIDWYFKLGDRATEADRIKFEEAQGIKKNLNDKWVFEQKQKGRGNRISLSSISDLIEPLRVAPDIRAALDRAEKISEDYKKRISETTDEGQINKLIDEYFKSIKDVQELIDSENFVNIIESRQDDIAKIKELVSVAEKQFKQDLIKKHNGKTDDIYYKLELKQFENKVDLLKQEINNFDDVEKGVLASTRNSLDRLIGTTAKVNEFIDKAINFEDTEEALTAINDVMNLMKSYGEDRAAGKTMKVKARYKADITKRLSDFRAANTSAYQYRTEELTSRKNALSGDISLIQSNQPLSETDKQRFYKKYGTINKADLLKAMSKEMQTTEQGLLSAEAIFQRGESRALGVEKTIRTQDREDIETIKNFASERVIESMNLLVDHYKTVQDEMLQAQRERVEAEIENERRKVETMNEMNSAAVELGLISQQDYAINKMKLEQELYEKENALMKEQFENEKKSEVKMAQIKLTQRLAEIALNVLVAESSKGIIGLIGAPATIGAFSALAMAQSAMEIAAINKKEYVPKRYANGGIVEGASHANGGVPFTVNGRGGYEMEGGEFIVKKSEVPRNIGALRAINNGTFQSSSYYSNSDEISLKLDALIEASNKPIRAYVTSGDLQKNARARVIIGNKTQL